VLQDNINTLSVDICQGDSLFAGGSYQASQGTYYDTLIKANGCDSIVITTINIIAVLVVIDGDTLSPHCQSVTLTASGAVSYLWNTGDTTNSITENPDESVVYTVTGTGAMGCTATDSITITVDGESNNVYLPNIFSPSSSQEDNKRLHVFGTCIDSLELVIYDRWGEVVFETTDTDSRYSDDGDCCIFGPGWDGTYMNSGKPLNTASFAFILKGRFRNGDTFFKSGNTILQ
jgi:hypothetical protein